MRYKSSREAIMRTPSGLPPKLLRAAKARAAERGETLEALLTRAVQNELARPEGARRNSWPLLRTRHKQKERLTNADIEEILAADDIAKVTRGR